MSTITKWNDLSLRERAAMIRTAVENGMYKLGDIKKAYNEFAEGGNIYDGTTESTQQMNTSPRPITTGGAGYIPPSPNFDFPRNIQDARTRLYNQVSPVWGFTDDTLKATLNTLMFNKNAWTGNQEKVTVDDPYVDGVWAEYLQIPEDKRRSKYKLEPSEYRPTVGDEKEKTYYKIPIESEAKDALIEEGAILPIGSNKLSTTLMGYNHGEHTIGKGVDPNKGEYISYYDRWDLNPLSSRYSSETKFKNNPIVKKLGLLDNRKYGDLSFGLGKPLDFYDRLYLDDYYGVDTTKDIPKNTYYGGWLPELFVDSFGDGFTTNRMGNVTELRVPYNYNKESLGGSLVQKANEYSKGGRIYIKPSHRGRFTRLKERTGHSASWFKAHGTPAQKKMATFALNARKWKHANGGPLIEEANLYDDGGPYKPGTIYGRPTEEGLKIVSPEFDALMLGRVAGNAIKETAGKLLNNGIAEAPTDEVLDTAVKRAIFTGQEFKKNVTDKVKDIGDWIGYMRTNIRNKDYKNALFDAATVARRAVNTGAYVLGTPGRFVNNVIPEAYRPFYREWYATVKPTFPVVLTGHDYSE